MDKKKLLFITAGLGGMSGAQPKAANIAGVVSITAEINPKAAYKRQEQGWVDEVIEEVDKCIDKAIECQQNNKVHSIAFLGNIVDLWERLAERISRLIWEATKLLCIILGREVIIRWEFLTKKQTK
ncbi:hypothetical protein FACS1894178_8980 [Bacteroidia bacterium]|nr:hypothetical protein FACS1894178_8980 [Bacteroidia bacterium]